MHEDVQPVAEPAEPEAESTEVLPAWQRPWVRSAVLTGMTVGAFAVAALAGDPSTVVGIG